MSDPTRIRAQANGERTTVRILMAHEMESGQRKDAQGQLIPAWHIQDLVVALNSRQVLTVQCGPSLSKNPFLQFLLKGAKPGDRLSVSWVDTRGQKRSDEALVS